MITNFFLFFFVTSKWKIKIANNANDIRVMRFRKFKL